MTNKLLLAIMCALTLTGCADSRDDRIAHLESNVLALIGDNGRMTAELEDQSDEIEKLKAEVSDLEDRIVQLEFNEVR